MTRERVRLDDGIRLMPKDVSSAVQLAGQYMAMIWMEKGTHHVNAKSVMGLLSLELRGGTEFEIIASGQDEAAAAAALAAYWRSLGRP